MVHLRMREKASRAPRQVNDFTPHATPSAHSPALVASGEWLSWLLNKLSGESTMTRFELDTVEGAADLYDALKATLPQLEIGSFEHEQLQSLLETIGHSERPIVIAPIN